MKARALLDDATRTLKASPAIDHWQKGRERIEAEDLLGFVVGHDPEPGDKISAKKADRFRELVARRADGEPIAYIKGFTEYRDLEILVEPGVFVPRDSSEFLAEQAVRRLRKRKHPIHVDLATDAVKLARRNARRLGLKARFTAGDLFDPLPATLLGSVDVITLHPPYVAAGEVEDLPDEIKEWEPVHTLTDSSVDGLGLVRRTVEESPDWLRKNGWLLMETDPDRAKDVRKVFREGGFRDVQSTKGGWLKVTRVIVGKRPS